MSGAFGAGAASPSPCRNNNYDFTLRYERAKLFERVLFQFDANMKKTSQAMREVATCFSGIGDSYEEVALCVSYATGGSAATTLSQRKSRAPRGEGKDRATATSGGALQDQDSLQHAAKVFCSEARRMRDGDCYVEFNEGVHKKVLGLLDEVHAQAKKAIQIGQRTDEALKKLNKARTIVEKKVAKYERLGRPLTESKRYPKQKKTMDDAEAFFESKAALFDEAYQSLMQTKLSTTGACIDNFLDLNLSYLCHLLQVLSCLAPNGARIVDDMIEGGRKLGQRMGVPEDNLLASAVNPSRADRNGRSRSAHNFTSFYRNRKGGAQAGAGAEADDSPTGAMTYEATANNRREAPVAAAKLDNRRARSPSVRIPQATGPATAQRSAPCEPRRAGGTTPVPAANEVPRADSNAPFGDTPKVQYQNRHQQLQQQQRQNGASAAGAQKPAVTVAPKVHTRPTTTTATTTANAGAPATASRTPAAPGHATRAPSHEPFDDQVVAPSQAAPVSTKPTGPSSSAEAARPAPVARSLFSSAASRAAPVAAAGDGSHRREAPSDDDAPMRPTTATTLFDFPSIPSVSTATPVSSQWATRNRLSARHGGPLSGGGGSPSGASAPPAEEDEGDSATVSVSSVAAERQRPAASSGFQPVSAFLPDPEQTGESEACGRPTVSASSLMRAQAGRGGLTQPPPMWQTAGGRPSSTSIPELPSKGSPSSMSGRLSARSEGGPALTPAGATSGTTTPPPAFDWGGVDRAQGSQGGIGSHNDGLVSVSWNAPEEQ